MAPIQRYSLETHAGPYASWPLTSVLFAGGQATGARVPGYVIEAQYQTSLGALLITSYNCPFEEANAFVLLDAEHAVIARADLAAPYDSFLLSDHWPIDALTLGLHYQERLFFTLSVQAPGRWPWRKPRLRLRPVFSWHQDERMREAHDRLQADLARISADLGTGARRD